MSWWSRSRRSATSEQAFKEDAAHLLFDEARLLDGDRPADARLFSDRLARVLGRGLRSGLPPDSRVTSAIPLRWASRLKRRRDSSS